MKVDLGHFGALGFLDLVLRSEGKKVSLLQQNVLVYLLHLPSLCQSQTVTIKHSLVPVSKFLSAARYNPEHLQLVRRCAFPAVSVMCFCV